jgi:hypothetical protein
MFSMSQLRTTGGWLLCAALMTVVATSCTRPEDVPSDQTTAQAEHQVPFHEGPQTNGAGDNRLMLARSSGNRDADGNLPFHDPQNLPAGTLVTVQLKNAVYGGITDSHASFEAVVAEPVVVEGNTLIPRGASVSGRVESARTSKVRPNRGYIRLALQSVQLGGSDLPVQTASLFARQAPLTDTSPSLIRLEKGRRLTFRLTEAVYTTSQRTLAGH